MMCQQLHSRKDTILVPPHPVQVVIGSQALAAVVVVVVVDADSPLRKMILLLVTILFGVHLILVRAVFMESVAIKPIQVRSQYYSYKKQVETHLVVAKS